jgi:predicted metalloprotease with PDZ domain
MALWRALKLLLSFVGCFLLILPYTAVASTVTTTLKSCTAAAQEIFISKTATGGVGFSLTTRHGIPMVAALALNEPGARAGVRSGDVLLSVNGINVLSLSVEDVSKAVESAPVKFAVKLLRVKDAVACKLLRFAQTTPSNALNGPQASTTAVETTNQGDHGVRKHKPGRIFQMAVTVHKDMVSFWFRFSSIVTIRHHL